MKNKYPGHQIFILALIFLIHSATDSYTQVPLHVDAQNTHIYYVSTIGNDCWTGRLPIPDSTKTDGPFSTLEGARNAIRKLKTEGKFNNPVTVMVLGGTYYLEKTFTLNSEDSGSGDCPITYMAFPGEKPILSGGQIITDWRPYEDKIWQCDLKNSGITYMSIKQLVYNNERQALARFPNLDRENPRNGGYLYLPLETIDKDKTNVNSDSAVLEYNEDDWRTWQQAPTEEARGSKRILKYDPERLNPEKWAKLTQVEVNVLPYHNWDHDIIPIKEVDLIHHNILLAEDASKKLIRDTRFYIQNALEELDSPGEWYLDRDTEILYFWPMDKIPNNGDVVVPNLDRIISFEGEGEKNNFLQYLNFGGFTIQVCNDDREDYAISLRAAHNCVIFKNTITNIGGHGIIFDEYCSNNRVLGNDITQIGRSGILINGSDNIISNNHIYNTGVIHKSVAIYLDGLENTVSNNLIHDVPTFGIKFKGKDHIIEFNDIHHYGLESTLSGGIYAWSLHDPGAIAGNIIRFNKVTDAVGYGMYTPGEWGAYPCWGIWLDDMISNTTVYGNILVRNVRGGVQLHGGENNLFENNIMVAGLPSTMNHIRRDGRQCHNRVVRNIIYYTNPDPSLMRRYGQIVKGITGSPYSLAPLFFVGWAVPEVAAEESDYNLFCPIGGKDLDKLYFYKDAGKDLPGAWVNKPVPDRFAWWREQGFEKHSISVEDPLFVDAANGDFRLQPGSPALQLGFKPIPIEKIGLFQSQNRASWPVENH